MTAPTLTPGHTPAALKLTCRKCGSTGSKTRWQTFADQTRHVRSECDSCGAFLRYLPLQAVGGQPACVVERHPPEPPATAAAPAPGAIHPAWQPPPAGWRWVGFLRQADGVWRPVCNCASLAGAWSALLSTWQQGDYLIVPTKPNQQHGEEELAA